MGFNRNIQIIILSLIFILSSCNTSKKTGEGNQNPELSDDKNYVMTVLLEFLNKVENQVVVYDIITKEGLLKDANMNDVNLMDKYLSVFDYNDNTPRIKRTFPDPLNKVVEFVDANGNLGKKKVTLDSDVVPLRINYNKEISNLKIYEREGREWKLISSFLLNQ